MRVGLEPQQGNQGRLRTALILARAAPDVRGTTKYTVLKASQRVRRVALFFTLLPHAPRQMRVPELQASCSTIMTIDGHGRVPGVAVAEEQRPRVY